jgi:pyruvate/2-oxoglutarate dehydrogenase complex dihydrolipoamide acyltransferase (E2) component
MRAHPSNGRSGVRAARARSSPAAQPVVVDGRVEARQVLPIAVTIDHRYVDGWHLAHAIRSFQAYLAAPP